MSNTVYNAGFASAAATWVDSEGADTINASWNGLLNKTIDLGGAGDVIVNTSASFWLVLDSFGSTGDIRGIEEIIGAGTGNAAGRVIQGTSGGDRLDFSATTLTNIRLIEAMAGHDTVIGSAAGDLIHGNEGNDSLNGGAGDDTLSGGGLASAQETGANTLEGGAGNDVFLAGHGADRMSDTGGGTDEIRATYENLLNDTVTGGVERIVNANASFWLVLDSFGGANGDIRGVTEIVGAGSNGAAGRTLWGTLAGDALNFSGVTLTNIGTVDLRDGNDSVTTGAAHSTMTAYLGGAGTDTISIVLTREQIGALTDIELDALFAYVAAPTGATLTLGSINVGASGFEAASFSLAGLNLVTGATEGPDSLRGTMNPDYLNGLGGNDTINPITNGDVVIGGAGDDLILFTFDEANIVTGSDVILAGAGNDTVDAQFQRILNSVVRGGEGHDAIRITHPSFWLELSSVGGNGRITGFEEIIGNGTGSNSGRLIQGAAGVTDSLDFTGITLNNIARVQLQDGSDVVTAASAHINGATLYDGRLVGGPGGVLRIDDDLYDVGGTTAGVTSVFLQGTTTLAFTFRDFQFVETFLGSGSPFD